MTLNISKEVENSIHAAVRSGRFQSVDDAVTAAWLAYEQRPTPSPTIHQGPETSPAAAQRDKPIWERILERTSDIPDEEWDKLPTDLAEQHDHYLYGTPKHPAR